VGDLNDVCGVVEDVGRFPLRRSRTNGLASHGSNQGSSNDLTSTPSVDLKSETLGPIAHNTTASERASINVKKQGQVDKHDYDAGFGTPDELASSCVLAAYAINVKKQGQVDEHDHDAGLGTPDELASPCVIERKLYYDTESLGAVGDNAYEDLFDEAMQGVPVQVNVVLPADVAHSVGLPCVLEVVATTAGCLYGQIAERMGLNTETFYLWLGSRSIPKNDQTLEALGIGQGLFISWCLSRALVGGSGAPAPASPKSAGKANGEMQAAARGIHSTLVSRLADRLAGSKLGERPSQKNKQTAYDSDFAKIKATVTEALGKRGSSVVDTARLHELLPDGQASILSKAAPFMKQNPCAYLSSREDGRPDLKCLEGCTALVLDDHGVSAELKIVASELRDDAVLVIRGTVAPGAMGTGDGVIDDNSGTLQIMFDKTHGGLNGATSVVFRCHAGNMQEFMQLVQLSPAAEKLLSCRERKRSDFGIEVVANEGTNLLCQCIAFIDAWLNSASVKVEDYLFSKDDDDAETAQEVNKLRAELAKVLCDSMKLYVKNPGVLAHFLFEQCALRLGHRRSASAPPEGGVLGKPALPDQTYLDREENVTNLLRTVAHMVVMALDMDTKSVAVELIKYVRFKDALSTSPLAADQDLKADGYQEVFVDTVKEFLTNTGQEVATASGSRPSIGEGLMGVKQAFNHMVQTSFTPGSMAGNELMRVFSQFMGLNGVGLANVVVVDLQTSGTHIVASTYGAGGLVLELPSLMIDLHGSHYEAVRSAAASTWHPPRVWQEQAARSSMFARTVKQHQRALVAKSVVVESPVKVSKCICGKGMHPDAKCCVVCAALTWVPEATGDKKCLGCGGAVAKENITAMHCAPCFAKATKSAQQQATENRKKENERIQGERAALEKQIKLANEKHAAEIKLLNEQRQKLGAETPAKGAAAVATSASGAGKSKRNRKGNGRTCGCGKAVDSRNTKHDKCSTCFGKSKTKSQKCIDCSAFMDQHPNWTRCDDCHEQHLATKQKPKKSKAKTKAANPECKSKGCQSKTASKTRAYCDKCWQKKQEAQRKHDEVDDDDDDDEPEPPQCKSKSCKKLAVSKSKVYCAKCWREKQEAKPEKKALPKSGVDKLFAGLAKAMEAGIAKFMEAAGSPSA
jgi:hypothetical protein